MTSTAGHASVLPTSRRGWQDLLNHLEIRPTKGMGQNFLFERGVVRKIVDAAELEPGSTVVEIGPGLGIMTEELLDRAGHVIAIEYDRELANHLRNVFRDRSNFQLIEADALKIDLGDLISPDQPYQIVANLPYSAASAIARHALEDPHTASRLTFMVQKEVADRMVASLPDMSILGVATLYYASARIVLIVPPDVFFPRPKVESAVVDLIPRPERPLSLADEDYFFRVVNAGFRQKRKQVANSLSAELNVPKNEIQQLLQEADIDPSRRAQTISVDEWVRFTLVALNSLA